MYMFKKILIGIALALLAGVPAFADITFVNGGFENGTLDGWTLGSSNGSSYSSSGNGLTTWSPGSNGGQAVAVVNPGPDPIVGINRTYNGNDAARVGDSLAWGYGGGGNEYNWISQSAVVTGSAPGNLYFAWAAILQISSHDYFSTPYFEVTVRNDTQSADIYHYIRYEQDGGFWTPMNGWEYSTGNNMSYPGWYVESLDLAALGVGIGDTLTLTALARDCDPSAHAMYVYLDGFGGTPPPPPGQVPEPSTILSLGAGLGMLGVMGWRRRK
jgi:hypothetical protein